MSEKVLQWMREAAIKIFNTPRRSDSLSAECDPDHWCEVAGDDIEKYTNIIASHAPTARTDDVILKAEEFRRSVNPLKIARELDAPTADHNEVAEEILDYVRENGYTDSFDKEIFFKDTEGHREKLSAILARHYGREGK